MRALVFTSLLFFLLEAAEISESLQNLRIQVNNDNLQQPPYLLEPPKPSKYGSSNRKAASPIELPENDAEPPSMAPNDSSVDSFSVSEARAKNKQLPVQASLMKKPEPLVHFPSDEEAPLLEFGYEDGAWNNTKYIQSEKDPPATQAPAMEFMQTQDTAASPRQTTNLLETPFLRGFDEPPGRLIVDDSLIEQLKLSASAITAAPPVARQKLVVIKPDPRCANVDNLTTFEHPTACDKYFQCENGAYIERTCPNGLLYGTREIVRDSCVFRWHADCGDKAIPNPKSSPGCRWQNGLFNVEDSPRCSPDYYECIDGKFYVKRCELNGQMYDDRMKSCRWAEGMGCSSDIISFTCPSADKDNVYWPFPRYYLSNDAYIMCVNDKPRVVRCAATQRVHVEELYCVNYQNQY